MLNEDIFVLLPGIMGSVLTHHDREVWGPSAGSIFRALKSRGESIRDLQMQGDDANRDDLGDGVTATRIFPDVTIIPGFWKIDGYTWMANTLVSHFGLTRGESFFEFPYDWRRCNAVAARKLQRNVHDWLEQRKQAGAKDPKVTLACHSMGGLVARHFLEVLGGWQQTRALVTFGTPYRGSLNALGYLANGYSLAGMDLTPLLRTLTSIYELLPIYPCVSDGIGELARVTETPNLPNVNSQRSADALRFHRKIENEQKNNASLPGYGYRIIPLCGFEQPTMQSARFVNGKVELLALRNGVDESGDGTVPWISSTPIELSGTNVEVFAAEKHGSLQNNDALLTHVHGALTRPQVRGVVRAGAPVGVSVSAEDAYREGAEIDIGVTAGEGKPEMEAVLEEAITNREIQRAQVRRAGPAGQRVIFDPVPAGHYRFHIRGEAVSPLSDVFVVG